MRRRFVLVLRRTRKAPLTKGARVVALCLQVGIVGMVYAQSQIITQDVFLVERLDADLKKVATRTAPPCANARAPPRALSTSLGH